MSYYKNLVQIKEDIEKKVKFKPQVAIVLGSGLGNFAAHIKPEATVKYSDIKDFPVSTIQGHAGQFIFGYVDHVPVVAMQGRVHYYEGYSMTDVTLPIRLMGMLGAKVLFLSNAAGGINAKYTPGTLMLIKDHISSFVPSPLIGENIPEFGVRFPDMSSIYNKKLQQIIMEISESLNIPLEQGVYLQTTGPQYESAAEIKMYQALGADAVGMSTACEAIAANHMGLAVCGVSCITNLAAGLGTSALDHGDVQAVADKVSNNFQTLVKQSILKIYDQII